jgi:hypothetical protein
MKRSLLPTLVILCVVSTGALAAPDPLPLWPGRAPGETAALPPENDTTTSKDGLVAGKRVIRIGNVSQPTIAIYSPPAGKNTGAAVLVCPGGVPIGFWPQILRARRFANG